MEFYNLTIEGISPTVGHQIIVFGDLKENLFAATKVIVDEELKALHDIGTTYYETNVLEKSIEFQNSILPIVEQLYADGFFNEVLDPNVDTDTIYEYTYLTYQDRNYTVLLENSNTTVRGKYTVARLYEERIDAIVNKIAQAHKKVGALDV